jgi:hypothetical protein
MNTQEDKVEILDYAEIEAKIKRKNLIFIIIILLMIPYTFLLLFYLMIIHNAQFQLSTLIPIALGIYIVADLRKKVRKLEGDLEYIIQYNKKNKAE